MSGGKDAATGPVMDTMSGGNPGCCSPRSSLHWSDRTVPLRCVAVAVVALLEGTALTTGGQRSRLFHGKHLFHANRFSRAGRKRSWNCLGPPHTADCF